MCLILSLVVRVDTPYFWPFMRFGLPCIRAPVSNIPVPEGGAPAWRPASVAEPGQGPVLGLLSSEQRQLQGRLAPALRPALQERAGAWPASHRAPGWLLAGWLAPHPGSTTSVSWLAGWPLQLATEIFPENICWEFLDGGGGGVEV